MPISTHEIVVGVVVYFAIDSLRSDPGIRHSGGSPDNKVRPFVCYARSADGMVFWTPLSTETTQSGRTVIPLATISNAVGKFISETVVVNDGRHTYSGNAESFAALSAGSDKFYGGKRVAFSAAAIALVLQAVAARGGQLPQT